MRLAVATLGLALRYAPQQAAVHAQQTTCAVDGRFALTDLTGPCSYDALLEAYALQVFDVPGACAAGGAGVGGASVSTAAADLDAKLINATGAATGPEGAAAVCRALYAAQDEVPFAHAADQGDDLHFEQQFYNGLSDWQDEVETRYEDYDGGRTSHLKTDAAKVKEFYDGDGSYARVAWPDALTNFAPATCTMHAAMCCWPKDRQANDNNGNCASPYDDDCVDKDPADNTNLCFADLDKGDASSSFGSARGFAAFPSDDGDGEGAVHCHGFAWADDEDDAISRYKANNLFYVSMYDHMYVRGYVKNIPGMPMCGCLDQMPLATRSDCTQVDLTEEWEVDYDPAAAVPFVPTMKHVDVDFNACRGRNNRNNDLWAYAARLYDEGKMSRHRFGRVGRVLTNDHDCRHGTQKALHDKGYVAGHHHDRATWTLVAGRDGLYRGEPHGRTAFDALLFEHSLTKDAAAGGGGGGGGAGGGIVLRVCPHCKRSHRRVYYRRLTAAPAGFDILNNLLRYRSSNPKTGNKWKVDFTLHSTYEDAASGANPWQCPNNRFNYHAMFDGECSPSGARARDQYSNWWWVPGPQPDVAFYVNAPQDSGPSDVDDDVNRSAGETDVDVGHTVKPGNTLLAQDGTYHMTASGWDMWGQKDSFHYLSQPWAGDVDVKVRMSEFTNHANRPYSKGGLMLRADGSPDATWVGNFLSHSKGVYFQSRKSKGNGSGNSANNWRTNPVPKEMWLRIVKKSERIEFYTAPDGQAWTLRGADAVFFPEDRYRVGLALTSGYAGHVAEANFDGYEIAEYLHPTASPTVSSAPTAYDPVEEVRTQRAGTYQAAADGTETFQGSGTDLWGRNDSFYFHSRQRPVAGDFTLTAYVADFPNYQQNARGGLMVRASRAPDAANAFVGAAGYRQGAVFQSRAAAGEETVHHKMVWANNENRFYVKLEKRGSALTASFRVEAADAWTVLGTTELTFPGDTLYVGRAVTAGRDYHYALETLKMRNYALEEDAK